MTLSESELQRIRDKYVLLSKFRSTLDYLGNCPQFLNARKRLREAGYLDWHILDAATQAVGKYRLDPPSLLQLSEKASQDFRKHGHRLLAYLHTFYEVGDEPLPPCEKWSAGELEKGILAMGLSWLARQRLLPRRRSFSQEEQLSLLRQHGFFEADPRPSDFPFPP